MKYLIIGNGAGVLTLCSILDVSVDRKSSIVSGVTAIQDNEYDVVFINHTLKDCNSLDCIKKIRSVCDTPIIVISAWPKYDTVVKSIKAGAINFLNTKGMTAKLVNQAISEVVDSTKKMKSRTQQFSAIESLLYG